MSANKDMLHLDAAGSLFFKQQLDYVRTKIIEDKLLPNDYARFLPVSAEMPLGASNFTWRSYTGYGQARMIADYARDFPRVEIGASEQTVKPKEIGAAYGYSLMEIRRAQYAGVDLETRKASLVRRVIDEKINAIAWKGDAVHNIPGFIKYPGSLEYTVPATGTGTTKTWSTKTADQILVDLNGLLFSSFNATNGIEMANAILLPPTQMQLIKNLRSSTQSDTTVFEFFTRNNPGVMLESTFSLKGAGTGGTDVAIAYVKDSDHLTFELPMPFEQLEAERKALEYNVPCMATVVGVISYFPLAITFCQGI